MKVQTHSEAKFALLNYIGLGYKLNKLIIIICDGLNGTSQLLLNENISDRIVKTNYKIFDNNTGINDMGINLNNIMGGENHKYIITIESMDKIKAFLLEFHDFFLLDMSELYCGLPKKMFGTKYVEAFGTNVTDYSINGINVQDYLRNKFNND